MGSPIRHIWFFNPPGALFQRGEDRCQANVEASSAVSLRAPNDLAYMASVMRAAGIRCAITDFPAEDGTWDDFEKQFSALNPDLVVMSITNATLRDDMEAFRRIKKNNPSVITVAKGAWFWAGDLRGLSEPVFEAMDYALVGEAETEIKGLVEGLHANTVPEDIPNIIFRLPDGTWKRTRIEAFETDLDAIPFPARDLLKNDLYVRPDTGEAQATIQTARGCPSQCVFCLTPAISGARVRSRSPQNIVDELEECVTRYGIRNFFFKADTFTINKKFVIALCQEILRRNLDIAWVANSRVDTVDEERLAWMKKAGCWLVAFGFESGNDDVLKKMKKEATVEDARRAAALVRQGGLKMYGFFMIGLPWDNDQTIRDTIALARELACDFYEIHLATPFEGTELYTIAQSMGLLTSAPLGHDYFADPASGSLFLSRDQLVEYRKSGLRSLYLSPSYIYKTARSANSPKVLLNYARYGVRLFRNLLKA